MILVCHLIYRNYCSIASFNAFQTCNFHLRAISFKEFKTDSCDDFIVYANITMFRMFPCKNPHLKFFRWLTL